MATSWRTGNCPQSLREFLYFLTEYSLLANFFFFLCSNAWIVFRDRLGRVHDRMELAISVKPRNNYVSGASDVARTVNEFIQEEKKQHSGVTIKFPKAFLILLLPVPVFS